MSGVAVVTGAARGIGRAITKRLLADGFDVVAVDVMSSVTELADGAGGRVVPVQADITTPDGTRAILEACPAKVAVLVNNAGITRDARVEKLTDEDLRAVLRVNLRAPLEIAHLLHDRLVPGASVVNLSSRSYLGNFGQLNYAISKGGIVGVTRSLALRWAPDVRVNAVAPGFIDSDMTRAMPEDVRARVVSSLPFRRPGDIAEVAAAVAWLASQNAAYVTGQVLFVCGGRSVG